MDDEDYLDDMLAEQEMMDAELAAEAEAQAAMLAVAQVLYIVDSLASWADDHDGLGGACVCCVYIGRSL